MRTSKNCVCMSLKTCQSNFVLYHIQKSLLKFALLGSVKFIRNVQSYSLHADTHALLCLPFIFYSFWFCNGSGTITNDSFLFNFHIFVFEVKNINCEMRLNFNMRGQVTCEYNFLNFLLISFLAISQRLFGKKYELKKSFFQSPLLDMSWLNCQIAEVQFLRIIPDDSPFGKKNTGQILSKFGQKYRTST